MASLLTESHTVLFDNNDNARVSNEQVPRNKRVRKILNGGHHLENPDKFLSSEDN